MATLNENEQLYGLTAVKANQEAFQSHEERAKFAMMSRCPLKRGDTLTILNDPNELVGAAFYGGKWHESLRVKVNGEDQNISISIFVKERSDIEGGIATADGDLNDFIRENKSLLPDDFRKKLAAEMAGDYIISTTTHVTMKLRFSDEKRYASAETFYSANKKA